MAGGGGRGGGGLLVVRTLCPHSRVFSLSSTADDASFHGSYTTPAQARAARRNNPETDPRPLCGPLVWKPAAACRRVPRPKAANMGSTTSKTFTRWKLWRKMFPFLVLKSLLITSSTLQWPWKLYDPWKLHYTLHLQACAEAAPLPWWKCYWCNIYCVFFFIRTYRNRWMQTFGPPSLKLTFLNHIYKLDVQ